MGAFVQDLERFRGTGEKNRQGKSLEDFISVYDAKKYDCPSNTVDMVVLRSDGPYRDTAQSLRILLVKRSNHPCIGWWALPGGFVDIREDLDHAARRELEEETGVRDLPMIQLRTWGAWDRDPRWRVITTSYLALVEDTLPVKAGDDAADAVWFDLELEESSYEASTDKNAQKTLYSLKLTDPKQQLALTAAFARVVTRSGPLEGIQYELISSGGIAVDHSLILADAVIYLREHCNN